MPDMLSSEELCVRYFGDTNFPTGPTCNIRLWFCRGLY